MLSSIFQWFKALQWIKSLFGNGVNTPEVNVQVTFSTGEDEEVPAPKKKRKPRKKKTPTTPVEGQ